MTTEERRLQNGMLLLEAIEADRLLVDLENKAAKMSERLRMVAEWLSTASSRHVPISDTVEIPKRVTGSQVWVKEVISAHDKEMFLAVDFKAAISLVEEIKGMRAKWTDLEERKARARLK